MVEVKSATGRRLADCRECTQVSRYWGRYRLVLVTNYRDFVLVGEDANGNPARLESFRLAADAEEFDRELQKPRAYAQQVGRGAGGVPAAGAEHTARGWPSRGTWPTCWPRMRAMRWLALRPPKLSRWPAAHRWRPCG